MRDVLGKILMSTVGFAIAFSSPAFAQNPKRKARLPASVAASRTGANGMPLLPDGTPDYGKFPNPFVVKKWTFELEGTSGKRDGGAGYSEFGLGANAYFYRWLAWRNVAFYRPSATAGGSSIYGLDMSERMAYAFSPRSGFEIFASPGFRFAGGGASAPFAEAGVNVKIAGIAIGGGVRGLARSWIETAASNEMQIFIGFSSGGRP